MTYRVRISSAVSSHRLLIVVSHREGGDTKRPASKEAMGEMFGQSRLQWQTTNCHYDDDDDDDDV